MIGGSRPRPCLSPATDEPMTGAPTCQPLDGASTFKTAETRRDASDVHRLLWDYTVTGCRATFPLNRIGPDLNNQTECRLKLIKYIS